MSYTAQSIRTYTEQLGVQVAVAQHDGGQTWNLLVIRGEESGYTGPFTVRVSFDWGDEDRAFTAMNSWLNTVSWPREDDPRVINEPCVHGDDGAYHERGAQ